MKDISHSGHKVRVLIVDDSAFVRRTLTKILERDPRVEVVGTAWDGLEAIEKISRLNPDVVTMDLNMPHMTGMEALDIIMREMPLPVIIVSSLNQELIEETLEALEHGAVDFIIKPTELASEKLYQIQSQLINKVVTIASLKGKTIQSKIRKSEFQKKISRPLISRPISSIRIDCVAIGVSTGGPTALYQIIPKLPEDFPAGIVIIQHMPPGFTKPLAERMNKNSNIIVKEAAIGDEVAPGTALVAPGGHHLFLERRQNGHDVVVRIDPEPSHLIHIPSIDLTFSNVADIYQERSLGIILTGMGKDGVEGLQKIKQHGGKSIAEDESTCVVFGMPEVAIRQGLVDRVAPIYDIAGIIMEMI